jgi:hypothetical protein
MWVQYTPLIRNLRGHGFFLSSMRVFLYQNLLNTEDVWPGTKKVVQYKQVFFYASFLQPSCTAHCNLDIVLILTFIGNKSQPKQQLCYWNTPTLHPKLDTNGPKIHPILASNTDGSCYRSQQCQGAATRLMGCCWCWQWFMLTMLQTIPLTRSANYMHTLLQDE